MEKKKIAKFIHKFGAVFFIVPLVLALAGSVAAFFFIGTKTWAYCIIWWAVWMVIGFICYKISIWAIWNS